VSDRNRPQIRKAAYALHYGSAQRPIATVVPDSQWPGMWRIAWSDGRLSDMVNLSRAKDAAESIRATGRDSSLFHWKRRACERALGALGSDLTAPPDEAAS
jgi:hypothetical protein